VTGEKQDVDGLLKALGVWSVDKVNHSPQILIGNDRTATWRRVGGLSGAEAIQEAIDSVAGTLPRKDAEIAADSPALRYFTDVVLIDQNGERRRLYSDLLHDKTVVIQVFFASCKNTCPQLVATFQKLQDHIGDRLGRQVHLISLTVDPEHDDVRAIAEHARRVGARAGWYLLTGPKEDVAFALGKLGMAVPRREEHSNIFLIGNVATGLWKKVRGLDRADAIADILDGVTADTGEPKAPAGAGG
jgi:protein SCO1/2